MNSSEPTETSWCERLYSAKAAELILYGRALGLGHGEAEDVLQEVFVGLLRRSEPPEDPAHYCVRAFRNRAFNLRRSVWRRWTREIEAIRWFEPGSGESGREAAAMKVLQNLPVDQREVIVLKIWHGYTFEELGELLGLSPNTAAGRYRYGMQKLRSALQEIDHESTEFLGDAFAVMDPSAPVARA